MDKTEVRYPRAYAQLTGQDGNAFVLVSIVRRAMLDAGYSRAEADVFSSEAWKCESYDALLRLCMRTVNVS